jgi:hypothetical protein
MNESQFYRTLVEATPQEWMWQRIETTTALGVPDINLFVPKMGEMWIETKLAKSGKTILRAPQYAWIIKRMYLGAKCAVVSRDRHFIHIWNERFNVVQTATDQRLMIIDEPQIRCTILNFREKIEKVLTKKIRTRKKEKV